MRIGMDARILAFSDRPTGLYQYTYHLIDALQEIDHENEYTLFFNSFRNQHRKVVKGYSFHRNIHKVNCAIPHQIIESLFKNIKFPMELLIGKVDLFHGPTFELLPRIFGKSVVTIHDLMFLLYPEFLRPASVETFREALLHSLKKTDAIIVVSEFIKNELIERCRVSEEKISVIYNGIGKQFFPIKDQERIKPIKDKYHIKNKYLLYLGNVEPKKNMMRIIESFHLLKHSGKIEHDLVIAGPKSYLDFYQGLIKKIKEWGLIDNIIFTDSIPSQDVPYLYNGAEAFIFASLYEGFGISPLEAMACGIPVVTSQMGSLKEICGEAAVLVNPLHSEDIAAGLFSVLKDFPLRSTLIQKGLARSSLYTWERAAQKTLALYKAI